MAEQRVFLSLVHLTCAGLTVLVLLTQPDLIKVDAPVHAKGAAFVELACPPTATTFVGTVRVGLQQSAASLLCR